MCTEFMCVFRWHFREQRLLQKLHWWGLSFSWTDCMWSVKEREWLTNLLQIWHWNLVFFSCTVSMWILKVYLLLRILLQNLHFDGFDFSDLAPVNSPLPNGFFASVLILIWFGFLWKYFVCIFKLGKFRNFLLHRWQLCNFCLSNVDGSY